MAVVGATLSFFVPGSRYPGCRQIVKAIPMNALHSTEQKLRHPFQSEDLDFLGAERRCSDFRDPYRTVCHSSDFFYFAGPLVYLPVIPVEWKSMHRHDIDGIEHPMRSHKLNKIRVDR